MPFSVAIDPEAHDRFSADANHSEPLTRQQTGFPQIQSADPGTVLSSILEHHGECGLRDARRSLVVCGQSPPLDVPGDGPDNAWLPCFDVENVSDRNLILKSQGAFEARQQVVEGRR